MITASVDDWSLEVARGKRPRARLCAERQRGRARQRPGARAQHQPGRSGREFAQENGGAAGQNRPSRRRDRPAGRGQPRRHLYQPSTLAPGPGPPFECWRRNPARRRTTATHRRFEIAPCVPSVFATARLDRFKFHQPSLTLVRGLPIMGRRARRLRSALERAARRLDFESPGCVLGRDRPRGSGRAPGDARVAR